MGCIEPIARIVQRFLERRPEDARLDRDGLIDRAQRQDAIHVRAQVNRNASPHALGSTRDARAGTVRVEGDLLFVAVANDALDVAAMSGVKNEIGKIFHLMVP